MSLECMLWAKKQDISKPVAKLVLICLADHTSERRGYRCWAGRKSIAKDASISDRAVSSNLKWLEENGYIERSHRHRDDGSRTTDFITLLVDRPSEDSSRGGEDKAGLCEDSSRHEPVTNQLEQPNGCSYTPSLDEILQAYDLYNELASEIGLPKAQVLSQTRSQGIRARLKDCDGLDGWRYALEKIRGSPFCQGAGDRGWRIDLSALCQAKTFTKLMEGSYDPRPRKANRPFPDERRSSPQDRQMAAFVSVGAERSGLDGT